MKRITKQEMDKVDRAISSLLKAKADITITNLVLRTGISRSRVSRIVKKFEEKKQVRRTTSRGIPYLRETDLKGDANFYYGRNGFSEAVNRNLHTLSNHIPEKEIKRLKKMRDNELSKLLKDMNEHTKKVWKTKKRNLPNILELGSKAIRYTR